jgi:hypothetical protein
MLTLTHSSTTRSITGLFLIALLFFYAVPRAAAADRPSDSEKSARSDSLAAAAEPRREGAPASAEIRTPNVLYVAFDAVGAIPVEPSPEPATRARRVADPTEPANAVPRPLPAPPPQNASGVISTAPMTVGEKFGSWFHSKFLAPGAYGSAIFNGMWKELNDNDDFKKDTVENYFADSMTRAARSFTSSATSGFYEKAVFASLFRQDPRYHRSGRTGAMSRIVYAATRVFVTQGDRCECHQFNASFLLGAAAYAGTANLWERRERTGPFHTASRFYNHVGLTAFFNVVREFVGGQ